MEPGLYAFSTKDDYELSISTGVKILMTKGFNVILEIEYQHREFTLEYDEYDNDSEGWLESYRRAF